MQRASLLKRFIAFVIDLLILNSILLWPFNLVILKKFPNVETLLSNPAQLAQISSQLAITAFLSGIVILLYFTFFEFKFQQTIGKYFVKIKISEQKSFSTILATNLSFIPAFPFVFLWLVDVVYLIFNPNNQRLTEKFFNVDNVEINSSSWSAHYGIKE